MRAGEFIIVPMNTRYFGCKFCFRALGFLALLPAVLLSVTACATGNSPQEPEVGVAGSFADQDRSASVGLATDRESAVAGVSLGLTVSAEDARRQSHHMATIIASRNETGPSVGAAYGNVPSLTGEERFFGVSPTPVGVWWWRDGVGDYTAPAVLEAHPEGVLLDLLDGTMDYYPPLGSYPEVKDYYVNVLSSALAESMVRVLQGAGELDRDLSDNQMNLIRQEVARGIGWEVSSRTEAKVRCWSDARIFGSVYRVGGVAVFSIGEWPHGVGSGMPFDNILVNPDIRESLVERVE